MPEQARKKLFDAIYIVVVMALAFALAIAPSLAQQAPVTQSSGYYGGQVMHASFGRTLDAGRIDGRSFADPAALQDFYESRQKTSFWFGNSGLNSNAHALIAALEDSWTHGLNPAHYHLSKIEQYLGRNGARDQAKLELYLTDALVRYAKDLSGMRINPESIKQRAEFWVQPLTGESVLRIMSGARDFEEGLASLAPRDRFYDALRKELVELAASPEREFSHVLPLNFGKKYFFPGEASSDVPNLRIRLGLPHSDSRTYDAELEEAIIAFQAANDLTPDGIIGPKTLDLLNQSNEQKMRQIVANLERLRWLDRELPQRYIVVNTANQMLWAVENGRVKHEMKVVVGKTWRRTKEFKAEITGVRLNPDWTIPPGIKRYDTWPKLKEKGSSYLEEYDIKLVKGYFDQAVVLNPDEIDWHNISLRELHDIRFIGQPGDDNPLGRIRILMPNRYNMYLHDTNHPELFEKPERTYSSGCIRVEDPHSVADFVMKHNRDWNARMKQEILDSYKKTDIEAEVTLPIYILHQTIWMNDKGELVFGPDIYKRDKDLLAVLEAMNGFAIPDEPGQVFASNSHKKLASRGLLP